MQNDSMIGYDLTNSSPACLMLNVPCDLAVEQVQARLQQNGLASDPSFNLRSTRAVQASCRCGETVAGTCGCQWVVLLVYGESGSPVSLVFDGREDQTQVSLVHSPQQPSNRDLVDRIWTCVLSCG